MDNVDLIDALKMLRKFLGYSSSSMAVVLNMSEAEYECLENRVSKPEDAELLRIYKQLESQVQVLNTRRKPMEIVSLLKSRLLDGSISTQYALGLLNFLARISEWEPLIEWVKLETSGQWTDLYEVPLYRLHESGYDIEYEQDKVKHFMSLPPEFIESIEEPGVFVCNDPIDKEDEEWLRTGLMIPVPEDRIASLELSLQSVYGPDFKLIRAVGMMSPEVLQKILLAVQEIMLRFLICLETNLDHDAGIDDLIAYKEMAGLLFREILDEVGSADHLNLPMKPQPEEEVVLTEGDEERFCDWLDQHLVTLYEMDGFLALRETFEEHPKGMVPPEMVDWAKKVNSSNWRFREDEEKLIKGLKVLYGVRK